MLEKLQDQLDVDVSKLVQLSMDGPNVNWSLYKILSEDLQKESLQILDSLILEVVAYTLFTMLSEQGTMHQNGIWVIGFHLCHGCLRTHLLDVKTSQL